MKRPFAVMVGAVSAILVANPAVSAPAAGSSGRHPARTSRIAPYPATATRAAAAAAFQPSTVECRAAGDPRGNVNLDCDDAVLPNNEAHIAVDPIRPNHLVASSNDYDDPVDEFYTSFDGGRTWITGDMSAEDPDRTGSDPVTSFDVKHRRVLHASLNYYVTAAGLADDGDIVVSASDDGGRTWQAPVVVAGGSGNDQAPTQIFNDKEWIVTDNNPHSRWYGRSYLTWSRFLSHNGDYAESPIWMAHSDDGGRSWSSPQEISGSSATCSYQTTGPVGECDEDQFSTPVVSPDGTLSVAFLNQQHEAAWEPGELIENQYMVVRSRDGGRTFAPPVSVVDLEDGTLDYPLNVDGSPTLTGFQARVNAAGDLAVDPRTGAFVLVFSDNRAGIHDVANPVTNTNVYAMTSRNGRDWAGPYPVATGPADQWFPWADVDPRTGAVAVLYQQEVGPGRYVTRLATGRPGRGFSSTTVSTAVSDASDAFVFQAGPEAGDCARCTLFFGDYNSVAYGTDGAAHMAWTDMRREATFDGDTGHTENIFYTRR